MITSRILARVCVTLLALNAVSAILVAALLSPKHDGTLAAVFAVNAGTSMLVGLVFNLPNFVGQTSGTLKLAVVSIAAVCGWMSAMYWLSEEVVHLWLRVGVLSPVLITIIVLIWFVEKAFKEKTPHGDERYGPTRNGEGFSHRRLESMSSHTK